MKPLAVLALEIESQGLFEAAGVPLLFTGVGKINAAHALTRRVAEYRHRGEAVPLVLNFGTAGSHTLPSCSIVACRSFAQRDMDTTALGFAVGVTPFDTLPAVIDVPEVFADVPHYSCSTGDSFETRRHEIPSDVLDMEAYALAKVCALEGVQFGCVKYITDGADHAAATDWQANLHKAAAEFLKLYRLLER